MKENFEYSEDEKGNYLQVDLERFSILYYFHPKSITVYYFDGWDIEDEVYAKQIVREFNSRPSILYWLINNLSYDQKWNWMTFPLLSVP